jgi:hypothetical protein
MSKTFLQVAFTSALALFLCAACQSGEQEAGQLLIQATSLLQRGSFVELKEHLDRVISEYPDTGAAKKAVAMQAELTARTNDIARTVLQSALAASVGYSVSYPDETLDLQKIKGFGFEGVEGVEIDFVRSEPKDFLISASHVAGNQVFTVGPDGVISARAK